MRIASTVMEKLEKLKELDGTIDFSKSDIQIEIVFAFIFARSPLTPSELSKQINARRKAVLDALRKLQIKGIVVRAGEKDGEPLYDLSELGKTYSNSLLELLGIKDGEQIDYHRRVEEEERIRDRLIVQRKIIDAYYLYKAIVYLANSKDYMLSLKKLSELLNLSPERTREYLDLYCKPPERVFKKLVKPGSRVTYYRLDKVGMSIYYKTPMFLNIKRSFLERAKMKAELGLPFSKKSFKWLSLLSYIALLCVNIFSFFYDLASQLLAIASIFMSTLLLVATEFST